MNGKAPGSDSMETQGSPARCVAAVVAAVVAVAAAAAAQCPRGELPSGGEAEAHGDPGPAGRLWRGCRRPCGEQGLAALRGAVLLSPSTQAPRALPESWGRRLRRRS